MRVPSLPCGTSSADSILSSSSGHLLSDAGTPGTISSASSVDDIESACGMSKYFLFFLHKHNNYKQLFVLITKNYFFLTN